jgi:hypothetical protein
MPELPERAWFVRPSGDTFVHYRRSGALRASTSARPRSVLTRDSSTTASCNRSTPSGSTHTGTGGVVLVRVSYVAAGLAIVLGFLWEKTAVF